VTAWPEVSIVVPTRDRPASLAACLDALTRQRGLTVEVVVVDDRSGDGAAVAAAVAAHPGARLVRGAGRGPAAARNVGARAALAPVLCFTDDDCRPDPGWAQALARTIGDGADVAAGPTRSPPDAGRWAVASQVITNHVVAESAGRGGTTVGFAPTSNVACRAHTHAANPFDESFPRAAGEDREWCARLVRSGIAIAWVPEAMVIHEQRLDLAAFIRQQFRYGRGAYRFLRADAGGGVQGAAFYARLLKAGVAAGPAVAALVIAAQVVTAAGVVAEVASSARSALEQRLAHHR
jgi:glycosyltransferase involved in cell wall biosynthesis